MPFDTAVAALSNRWRTIVFDRIGYGRSTPTVDFEPGYHREAARDLRAVLEGLGLAGPDRPPVLWGHSDGAIIAADYAAAFPEHVSGLVLEAVHERRSKSREFFLRMAEEPEQLPDRVRDLLAADHGPDRALEVVRRHSRAWLALGELGGSFFEPGSLERIRCPVLLLHGEHDPHTPLEEVRALAARLARVELEILPDGAHSPHSEPATALAVADRVERFLELVEAEEARGAATTVGPGILRARR
jgi:pimeloyl-ACP methyl ester carboxylesterase